MSIIKYSHLWSFAFLCLSLFFISNTLVACSDTEIELVVNINTADFATDEYAYTLLNTDTEELLVQNNFFGFNNTAYFDTICVPNNTNIQFAISCCFNNVGSFVLWANNQILLQDSVFQNDESYSFFVANDIVTDLQLNLTNIDSVMLSGKKLLIGEVYNNGSDTISSFVINVLANDTQLLADTINGIIVPPFQALEFVGNAMFNLVEGDTTLSVFISTPNNTDDQNNTNDTLWYELTVADFASSKPLLIEGFTNAGCVACATADPIVNNLLNNPITDICPIVYHTTYPGVDSMAIPAYLDIQQRIIYYGFPGVPRIIVEGGAIDNLPTSIDNAELQAMSENASLLQLFINEQSTIINDSFVVKTTLGIKTLANINTYNHVLYIGLTEQEVLYTTPPGTNGLTDFYHVFRGFISGSQGINLPNILLEDSLYYYTIIHQPNTLFNFDKLRTFAFIQNNDNKQVLQSLMSPLATGNNQVANTIQTQTEFGLLNIDMQAANCNNLASIGLSLQDDTPTADINFDWSNGASGQFMDTLSADSYTISLSNGLGIFDEVNINIPQLPLLDYTLVFTQDTVSSTNSASIVLNMENIDNYAPMSYLWSNGSTANTISNLVPGNYSVSITDVFGCTYEEVFTVDLISSVNLFANEESRCKAIYRSGTVILTSSCLAQYTNYRLFNVNGQTVGEGVVRDYEIIAHTLSTGVYFIHLFNSQQNSSKQPLNLRFVVLN